MQELEALVEHRDRKVFVLIASDGRIIDFGSRDLHIMKTSSEVRASIGSDQTATRILTWSLLGADWGANQANKDDDLHIEADSFASKSGMIHGLIF